MHVRDLCMNANLSSHAQLAYCINCSRWHSVSFAYNKYASLQAREGHSVHARDLGMLHDAQIMGIMLYRVYTAQATSMLCSLGCLRDRYRTTVHHYIPLAQREHVAM